MKRKDVSKEAIEARRSKVRVRVTYAAAAYVFGGSAVLISALWYDPLDAEKLNVAKDVFMIVMPVATGIITYWFASRKPPEAGQQGEEEAVGEQTAASTKNVNQTDDEMAGVETLDDDS